MSFPTPPRLSLAMIVRNEAEHLGHCLASVRGLVDEVHVVDTGSTDGTVQVAREAGAQIHAFPWQDDFAAARNASLAPCRGEWILVLDADEAVDALDHERIRQACLEEGASAYTLLRRNYLPSASFSTVGEPATRNTSAYAEGAAWSHYVDHRGLRLFRNLEGVAFEGRIHELVQPFFERRGLPVRPLDAVIHHYGKVLEARERHKRSYYLELARREAEARGDLQAHFNLLQQALVAEAWPLALEAARACMALGEKLPLYVFLGAAEALQHLDRHAEALGMLERLLAVSPSHGTALTLRGVSLAVLGRREEAFRAWEKAIAAAPGFAAPYLNAAELAVVGGDLVRARRVLDQGLAAVPGDAAMHEARIRLGLRAQDLARAAADAWTALQACPEGGGGLWHRLAALGLLQAGAQARAFEMLEQGLARFPGDAELLQLRARLGG